MTREELEHAIRGGYCGGPDVLRDAVSNSLPGWAHRISLVALGLNDVARLIGEGPVFWRELERDAVVLAGEAPGGIRERMTAADRQ